MEPREGAETLNTPNLTETARLVAENAELRAENRRLERLIDNIIRLIDGKPILDADGREMSA